jgi:isoamylase
MLATLLLSFGVPMLLGGDELGRTQHGNNNAYCHDSPLTWFDWANADNALLEFTRRLIALRRTHPVFRRRRFFCGIDWRNLRWYTPAGQIVTGEQWADHHARAVAIYLEGDDEPDRAADGNPLIDDDFLILVNAWWEPLDFLVPPSRPGQAWYSKIDTFDLTGAANNGKFSAGDRVTVGPRSLVVLHGPLPSYQRG